MNQKARLNPRLFSLRLAEARQQITARSAAQRPCHRQRPSRSRFIDRPSTRRFSFVAQAFPIFPQRNLSKRLRGSRFLIMIEPDNIVLTLLRRIDATVARMSEDLRDLKVRVTAVAEGLVGVNRRLDRLEARVERIDRRLDLAEAT